MTRILKMLAHRQLGDDIAIACAVAAIAAAVGCEGRLTAACCAYVTLWTLEKLAALALELRLFWADPR